MNTDDHSVPQAAYRARLSRADHNQSSRPTRSPVLDGRTHDLGPGVGRQLEALLRTAASSAAFVDQSTKRQPSSEQLPVRISYEFTTEFRPRDGRPVTIVHANGIRLGDPLTDAAAIADYYRLHDVFHLSYATLLGWSPVTRALLGRKRRSVPGLDENEDGGRAVVVEEGIAAMAFGYAARRDYLRGHNHIEACLLDRILETTAPFEIGNANAADWEHTLLTGFRLWRQLRAHGGTGTIQADRLDKTMVFTPAAIQTSFNAVPRVGHLATPPAFVGTRWARHQINYSFRLAG